MQLTKLTYPIRDLYNSDLHRDIEGKSGRLIYDEFINDTMQTVYDQIGFPDIHIESITDFKHKNTTVLGTLRMLGISSLRSLR